VVGSDRREQGATTPKGSVLVVDDDPAVARSLGRILGSICEVAQETCAKRALARILAGERFAAIIVDLHMGELSGVELHAAILREVPEQANRVVLLTGESAPMAPAIPVHRVLTKPVPTEVLRSIVGRLMLDLS
jgi:CheY-like chemotaxis protein